MSVGWVVAFWVEGFSLTVICGVYVGCYKFRIWSG